MNDQGRSWIQLSDEQHCFGQTLRLAANRGRDGRISQETDRRGVI